EIEASVAALEAARRGSDHRAIKSAIEALNRASAALAARRMNRAIASALSGHGIEIEHACEKSCACTTCHVVVRAGYESLEPPSDKEDDLLDKAWGLELTSRLSCQAKVADEPLEIEIPKYTINQV